MATAADRIKANAARINATASRRPQAPEREVDAAPPPDHQPPDHQESATGAAAKALQTPSGTRSAVRNRDVRRTVDLSPSQHRSLDIWQRQAADALGYARVTGQEVLSALVDLLLDDQQVSGRVISMLPDRR